MGFPYKCSSKAPATFPEQPKSTRVLKSRILSNGHILRATNLFPSTEVPVATLLAPGFTLLYHYTTPLALPLTFYLQLSVKPRILVSRKVTQWSCWATKDDVYGQVIGHSLEAKKPHGSRKMSKIRMWIGAM
ncbi:hypothetical protein C8F04DRAFT_1188291 [Mycena alexandri]|uniref:Uncharacterized protein n=1 Tax=Mycena alexandri TaxID=1745969 RepID=A0AAD6SK10_9AGAR|nr:hypothetical protein C8F04DRAFT_1188291 [Mycena alexandri]